MTDLIGTSPLFLFTATWMLVERLGVFEIVETIAHVLLLYFITSQALAAALSGRSEQLRALFVRAVIASVLLTVAPWIQGNMNNIWTATYHTSFDMTEQVTSLKSGILQDQLEEIHERFEVINVGAAIDFTTSAGKASDSIATSVAAVGGGVGRDLLTTTLRWYLLAFRMVLIPVMAVFLVMLFASGLIVTLSAALLPVAAAMLASGGGAQMISTLISKSIASYISILVLPIAMGSLMELALYNPIRTLIEQTVLFVEAGLDWTLPELDEDLSWWERIIQRAGDIWNKVNNILDQLYLIGLRGLAMIVGGIIATIAVMNNIERYVTSLVNGIGSGASANFKRFSGAFSSQGSSQGNSQGGGGGGQGGGQRGPRGGMTERVGMGGAGFGFMLADGGKRTTSNVIKKIDNSLAQAAINRHQMRTQGYVSSEPPPSSRSRA